MINESATALKVNIFTAPKVPVFKCCYDFFDKGVELVGGGSLINGAYPVYLICLLDLTLLYYSFQHIVDGYKVNTLNQASNITSCR